MIVIKFFESLGTWIHIMLYPPFNPIITFLVDQMLVAHIHKLILTPLEIRCLFRIANYIF